MKPDQSTQAGIDARKAHHLSDARGSDSSEDEGWGELTREQFLRGYSESDSAYDGV